MSVVFGMRRFGVLLVLSGAWWIAAELTLAGLGVPMRGCCGGPPRVQPEHAAAIAAGVVALACAFVGRRVLAATHRLARPLARAVPLLAAGLMLGASVEALIQPFCNCARVVPTPTSAGAAWHHYAVQAF